MNTLLYTEHLTLADGSLVRIRPITPGDKQNLLDGFQQLKSETVFFRFFGIKKELSKSELKYLTEVDFDNHVALVAEQLQSNNRYLPVGVARYIRLSDAPTQAELAFVVIDQYQDRGIGSALFWLLVRIAKTKGVTRLKADLLSDNDKMLAIFQHSGFTLEQSTCQGVTRIEFDIN